MIEAHLENSIGRVKSAQMLRRRKVRVPKDGRAHGRSWQFGEDPFCCRSNAESYLLLVFESQAWQATQTGRAVLFAAWLCFFYAAVTSLCFIQTQRKDQST